LKSSWKFEGLSKAVNQVFHILLISAVCGSSKTTNVGAQHANSSLILMALTLNMPRVQQIPPSASQHGYAV
jgi:hypothetical protein